MEYLLDTGVLLRLVNRGDPLHAAVRRAVKVIKEQGHGTVTTSQNMSEFWNVCTRPPSARGGLGLSVEDAQHRLKLVERIVKLLPDSAGVYERWKKLLVSHRVSGVAVHDARLVAVMLVNGIGHILTLNTSDFSRYKAVVAVAPGDVVAAPPNA